MRRIGFDGKQHSKRVSISVVKGFAAVLRRNNFRPLIWAMFADDVAQEDAGRDVLS